MPVIKAEGRNQKAEIRRQKSEGRNQKAEIRRQKDEGLSKMLAGHKRGSSDTSIELTVHPSSFILLPFQIVPLRGVTKAEIRRMKP
jgi:hypothetical protein